MNILFVQHGDFAEAYRNLAAGQSETYRDQKRSVDFVTALSERHRITVAAFCDADYDTGLSPTLQAIGMTGRDLSRARINALLDSPPVDRLICRSPHRGMLEAARRRKIATLPSFADIFHNNGLRSRLRLWRLKRAMSGPHVPCIANHGLNASRSVARALNYPESRIVPWDWSRIPVTAPLKTGVADPRAPRAFFAGALSGAKGVGDCLKGIAALRKKGLDLSISFAGQGDIAAWTTRADQLGVGDAVRFMGRIPNSEVREEMARHDIVLVPSRHEYPEGMPNTIYEGLASRTPVILSDHPAFAGRLEPGTHCLSFRAGDPANLADTICRLARNPALYAKLSAQADIALDGLYFGMEWDRLVSCFIDDPSSTAPWIAENALSALTRRNVA